MNRDVTFSLACFVSIQKLENNLLLKGLGRIKNQFGKRGQIICWGYKYCLRPKLFYKARGK